MKIKDNSTFFDSKFTNRIIKPTCKTILLPFIIIYNQAISTGIFPTDFKKCLIVPLY